MRGRTTDGEPVDPLVVALRDADAEYHRLCIEIQEPIQGDLPLDELALAVQQLATAVEALRTRDSA